MKNEVRPIDANALTEEQLKKKVGDPIWIESARRAEWMILWGYHPPEVYGRAFIFTRRTAQKEQFPFSELGVTWNAYAHPPAHIDREPCEYCNDQEDPCLKDGCFRKNRWKCSFTCDKYREFQERKRILEKSKFCPRCGRPLTEQA